MINPFSLPVLGASLLVAVVVGVHLGESSVGLINPIYFQEPPLHPRDRGAAIDEASLNRRGPAFADLYGWEQGYAARAADCGNCEALRARDAYAYSAEVPYFGSGSRLRSAVAVARDELGERFAALPDHVSPRNAEVERYAHYRIVAEPESEPEPEPEPDLAVDDVAPPSDGGKDEVEEF
jgi:hypothetical protein